MKNDLTVIIPTLNNVKGLHYLLKYFKDKPYKVVVVDNRKKISVLPEELIKERNI